MTDPVSIGQRAFAEEIQDHLADHVCRGNVRMLVAIFDEEEGRFDLSINQLSAGDTAYLAACLLNRATDS